MSEAFDSVSGAGDLLVVVDHASRHVPSDVDLGLPPQLIERHIGWDIGAALVGRELCRRLDCPGLFGGVSRLVIDLHREEDSPALIPQASDGHPIPGNADLGFEERTARIERFWRPYHAELSRLVARQRPALIAAVHSFTPQLESVPRLDRPWQVGILYNRDERAARIAIGALRRQGFETGDNEPYSGRLLNATMNMHAEAHGIPYLAVELRNDLIRAEDGVIRWAKILETLLLHCRNELARNAAART